MPISNKMTPAESVIDAACRRDQKSGNRYVPKAPTTTKKDPEIIKIKQKTSKNCHLAPSLE